MKKLLIITVLLSLTTVAAFAERMVLIQASYMQTNRVYSDSSGDLEWTFSEAGINITNFSSRMSQGLGFYSSATFLIPIDFSEELYGFKTNATKETLDARYDDFQLGLDMLLGVGFLAPVTPNFSILAAGGLHFSGIALFSSYADSYLAYNLGPGIALNGLLHLTKSFNINISAMAAWDMWEFITMPDLYANLDPSGGVTWSVSAGLGFTY